MKTANLPMTLTATKSCFDGRVPEGDAHTAVIEAANTYSKIYADKGIDGMTHAKRTDYFNRMTDAIHDESVQQAFL